MPRIGHCQTIDASRTCAQVGGTGEPAERAAGAVPYASEVEAPWPRLIRAATAVSRAQLDRSKKTSPLSAGSHLGPRDDGLTISNPAPETCRDRWHVWGVASRGSPRKIHAGRDRGLALCRACGRLAPPAPTDPQAGRGGCHFRSRTPAPSTLAGPPARGAERADPNRATGRPEPCRPAPAVPEMGTLKRLLPENHGTCPGQHAEAKYLRFVSAR